MSSSWLLRAQSGRARPRRRPPRPRRSSSPAVSTSSSASTDNAAADLLVPLANSPDVRLAIEEALAQNFAKDIAKLQVKINKALTEKRVGDFVLNAKLGEMHYGVVQALGQGAYLPVEVSGTGSLELAPLSLTRK